ncbi:MAG TPA: hypothetical protein VJ385_00245 [Fibrobacteria bacterium]|nr:hypothetical protein [Fibrobacteria bacterium]
MKAHALGMPKDSLYYFLSEAALSRSAFDTAMAFNLAIPNQAEGPFRASVLNQRYRLYLAAGLKRDAAALRDSLGTPGNIRIDRHPELNVQFSSGYYREDVYPAWDYPFGTDLGGFRMDGPQFRNRARLSWPLFESGKMPFSGGVQCDLIKSYAKDSLDYRAGAQLKAENVFHDGVSLSLGAEIGKVAGTGFVTSCKLESSYLSFSGTEITMIQGGVESEWSESWGNRFSGIWVSFYQDRSLFTGRGFIYSLSVSGIRVDPIRAGNTQKVMFVDDVRKPAPTHYRDGTFQDTLPAKGISAYLQYVTNTGPHQSSSLSPQGFVTALPTLGYGFPLPAGFSGEIGSRYVMTVYPEAYEWTEAPLPAGLSPSDGDFRGLALNQADGKRYAAVLLRKNGGFEERYGAAPVAGKRRLRIDRQLGADVSLRRRLADWGTLTLDGAAKRNWSTLESVSPIWIPKWDMELALRWNRGWTWK